MIYNVNRENIILICKVFVDTLKYLVYRMSQKKRTAFYRLFFKMCEYFSQ